MTKVDKSRMEMISTVDMDKIAAISTKAWREAKIAHANIRKCPIDRDTGQPAIYQLGVRDKQKIFLDFTCNVMLDPYMQQRVVEWMWHNPGDYAKVYASMTPKEITVSGEITHGVMVVPAREKDIASWQERMELQTHDQTPFDVDAVNWRTEPHILDVEEENAG